MGMKANIATTLGLALMAAGGTLNINKIEKFKLPEKDNKERTGYKYNKPKKFRSKNRAKKFP